MIYISHKLGPNWFYGYIYCNPHTGNSEEKNKEKNKQNQWYEKEENKEEGEYSSFQKPMMIF